MQVAARCDFCDEFSGKSESAFNRIYRRNPRTRVLFRSDNFALVPSLGQLAEGHLLLLPIMHWTAIGDLTGNLLEDFAGLCDAVLEILRREYGSCVAFEHGVRSGGAGGCGISHAHLHFVPLAPLLDPIVSLQLKFPHKRLGDLSELGNQSKGMLGYILYADSNSRIYLFDTPNLESQYMRKILTTNLGVHEWDWRAAGREERLLATLNRLSGWFEGFRFSAFIHNK
jgi:diadenosine tetraphosphate (Ap4A) HIT family hydrolase